MSTPRPALVVLALLVGCVNDPDSDTASSKSGFPDPVDGCESGDGPAVDVEASLTDIPTVVRVTWHTLEPTDGTVHFNTATGPRHTAVSSGTDHEVLLVGNRADAEVPFRIVTDDGARVSCGEVRTIQTGALPSELPDLTTFVDPSYAVDGGGYTVAPLILQVTSFIVILDSAGQYVWAWADPEDSYGGAWFNADIDRARGGVFFNEQAISADVAGAIRHVAFDGTVLPAVDIEGGHTDFLELPDGTIASLSWDLREVDGVPYLGDRLVEVDTAGVTRTVWSVWDHYTPNTEQEWPTGFYREDPEVRDWSHVNGLGYDAAADAYLVSMPFNQSVARVDRDTGEMPWAIMGAPLVEMPHSVQAVGDNVLVFNRGRASEKGACSEATEIDIATREVVWSYQSDPCVLVPFLGAASRLPNGNTLVDWSSAGQLDEVSATNELLWRVNLDLGAAFGFVERVASLYGGE